MFLLVLTQVHNLIDMSLEIKNKSKLSLPKFDLQNQNHYEFSCLTPTRSSRSLPMRSFCAVESLE